MSTEPQISTPGGVPSCRFCATSLGQVFVDLGRTALANRNLRPEEVASEQLYPLVARVCEACFLVQVDESVPPDAIFSDYDYFSSMSDGWVAHAGAYARAMQGRFGLGAASQVVEVASNDGYLLQHFAAAGVPVLGIEPAANVAAAARARGVPTETAFFGRATAERLVARGVRADLMAANNVLAHVPAIGDFVAGFAMLLKPEGVATFEFPHLLNLIEQVQFDTIYHEHFSYLSLLTTERVFAANGLRVFDVEVLPTHGGSLRVFACRTGASHATEGRVEQLRERERGAGLDTPEGYQGFAEGVARVRADFLAFLSEVKSSGRRLAAYGAAAKGNTFLNVCGATRADLIEVYDRSPAKQGKLLPGTHVPIVDLERLRVTKPDYLLVLPWNLIDEVRSTMAELGEWGGTFVTAVPAMRFYSA